MTKEERFIVYLLRKEDTNIDYFKELNTEEVINLLYEHKIFLHYADILLVDTRFKKNFLKIKYIKKILTKQKEFIEKILNQIVEAFEKNNIKYVIYKGIALEHFIYNCENKRQYNDIDIYIYKKKERIKAISIIKKIFSNVYDLRKEILNISGEEKIVINVNNFNVCVEIKNEFHFYKFQCEEIITIKKNFSFNTLGLEETFCYLVVYYYNFTRNLEFLRHQDKMKLQYALDLYNFLKKYKKILKKDLIKKIMVKNSISINDIYKIFNELGTLFDDDDLICNNLETKVLIDQLPIYKRFFYNNDIVQFIIKYCLEQFCFKENTLVAKQKFSNSLMESFEYLHENEFLILRFKPKICKDEVINICIFGHRKTGEFIDPYIPINIRVDENNFYINSLYYAPTYFRKYNFMEEKESFYGYIDKIIKINKLNNEDLTEIIIKLSEFPHNLDTNKDIGLNVYRYKLVNGYIKKSFCLYPYYDKVNIIYKNNIRRIEMKKIIEIIENYETPDFLDLDEIYGFSQVCSSGTAYKGCLTPCNAGF